MSTNPSLPAHQAATWFSAFPAFTYNPSTSLQHNFTRLAAARQWGPKLTATRWVQCQRALFGSLYGTDTSKLAIWQAICRDVGIQVPPGSITGCKKVCRMNRWGVLSIC